MTNHIYKPTSSIFVVAVIILISLFLMPDGVAHAGSAETFIVNSSGDDGDADTTDNVCSTTLVDLRTPDAFVTCTLRAAIEQANARASESDTIEFNISGFTLPFAVTIEPTSPLPNITAPVKIDARTQPVGLASDICANSSSGTHNILITIDGATTGASNGLRILNTAPGTRIHGLSIINFTGSGIVSSAASTEISCNHIGVKRDGITAAGNGAHGIVLPSGFSQKIGGVTPSGRNIISGNDNNGIHIQSSTSANAYIRGNYIGTDESGTSALPNQGNGVFILNSTDTNIGSTLGSPNVISGNGKHGIHISGISSEATKIVRNMIGTDRNGINAVGNTLHGIHIVSAQQTEIGGVSMASLENVISGNGGNGINITDGAAETGIYDNLIGTQVSPGLPLPNGGHGIEIADSEENYIGYSEIGNTIAFNGGDGVKIHLGADNNYLADNLILGNGASGIYVENSSFTQIGETGSGNSIMGNTAHGIVISGTITRDSIVQANEVGYDIELAVADGNGGNGILVNNASGTTIGLLPTLSGDTRALALSNFINSNVANGIQLSGNSVTDTMIQGNVIGTDLSFETELGNGGHGILVDSGATLSTIGDDYSNTIAFNDADGIAIVGATTLKHRVNQNYLVGNGGLMIDLENDGKTANDSDDSDSGANELQNFPVITDRLYGSDEMIITGTLTTDSNSTIQLDLYAVTSCDGGVGDGSRYMFSENVTSGSDGLVNFSMTEIIVRRSITFGFVAMTATDSDGNTSEFSDCIEVSSVPLAVGMISAETIPPQTAIPLLTILLLLLTIQPLRAKRHSRP